MSKNYCYGTTTITQADGTQCTMKMLCAGRQAEHRFFDGDIKRFDPFQRKLLSNIADVHVLLFNAEAM